MKHSDAAEDKKLIRKEIKALEGKEKKAEEKAEKSVFKGYRKGGKVNCYAEGGAVKKPKKDPYGGDRTFPRELPKPDVAPSEETAPKKYASGGGVKTVRGMGSAIKGGRYFD